MTDYLQARRERLEAALLQPGISDEKLYMEHQCGNDEAKTLAVLEAASRFLENGHAPYCAYLDSPRFDDWANSGPDIPCTCGYDNLQAAFDALAGGGDED